ncbi:hypothetical protein [Actinomadura sp. HBU206391]|uniref:hypothetical protein n=1 Tax=Actinomadura sp. HBU206391 TaxID=2731692 RepID=UPI00164F1381|nr:hypothetical protein [Actinomadura sp. HBU206391]MBC6460145.1 hypothetical protein [Actinomadura sp. HBU206391]
MSQFHDIFCTSDAPLIPAEIAERAGETWYGDGEPAFIPDAGDDPAWRRLEMRLPGIRRPIVFLRNVGPDETRIYVDQALEEAPGFLPPEVTRRLRATRQIIGIELWPETLDDDAWELLDLVQSFIATTLDGLLVTGDGVYDQRLHDQS